MTKWIKRVIIFIIVIFFFKNLYKYLPYRLEFLGHYDKIWAHRNNSIAKANIASKYFKGIELDLVYDKENNFLDVNHPPTKSIHLSFSDYIASLNKQPYLWLDIKNLKQYNNDLILSKLVSIFSKNDYSKSKILIETRFPEALPLFENNGFKVIYYLPYNMFKMNPDQLNKSLNIIRKVLEKQPNIGISSNYLDYTILNKYFPNRKKYMWITQGLRERNFKLINKVLNDKTVEVVLISFKTTNHR